MSPPPVPSVGGTRRTAAHAVAVPPYTVDSAALALVDGLVDHALGRGLTAAVNVHHLHEPQADPGGQP